MRTAAFVVVAVAGGVAVGGPLGVGVVFAVATAARLVDGRGWFGAIDREARGAVVAGGALAGAVALALALAASGPLGDALGRGVEWSTAPVVRGSITQAATVALVVLAVAVAAELALRRWLLETLADALVRGGTGPTAAAAAALAAAALVEAAIAPFDGDRAGIAITSAGLGVIHVAAGRRVAAPLAARLVFEVGAVVLQALRLVG